MALPSKIEIIQNNSFALSKDQQDELNQEAIFRLQEVEEGKFIAHEEAIKILDSWNIPEDQK